METITSRKNPIVKMFRSLARIQSTNEKRILLDGLHLVEEAMEARYEILVAAIRSPQKEQPKIHENALTDVVTKLVTLGTRLVMVSDSVMSALSPMYSPSEIVAIAENIESPIERAFERSSPLVITLVDVQDPGNVGASIRAAHAGGATAIVAAGRSANPFNWKALRGSMGSVFRLPVVRHDNPFSVISAARERDLRVVGTVPQGGHSLYDANLDEPAMFLFGGEGAGLNAQLLEEVDEEISVPMHPPVRSLNVAVTVALLVYETFRQKYLRRAES